MLNLTLRRCIFVFIVCLNFTVCVFAYISDAKIDVVTSRRVSPDAEELLRRREKVHSYLSAFEETEKDWVETYHSKLKEHKTQISNKFDETNSAFAPETEPGITFKEYDRTSSVPLRDNDDTDKTNADKTPSHRDEKEGVITKESDNIKDSEPEFSNVKVIHSGRIFDDPSNKLRTAKCGQERLYLIRWITKLLRKFENNEHGSLCFSFSQELLTDLNEISLLEDFDVVSIDELVCSLISNATFHDGSYRINFFPSIDNLIFYFGIIGGLIFSLYFLNFFIKKHPYITLTLLTSAVFIYCHAHKHYKSIMAQKHATMSRVLPYNCITTLTSESGVFDHITEFIRHSFYRDDCKKYYEAVMIDPSVEVSIPVVIADLGASVFFQLFKPLASAMNYFVKELLFDLSLIQKLALFPIFCFIFIILLLCFRYKIKLPFFLGSFEPTTVHIGSKAEDLKLENSSASPSVNVHICLKENVSEQCIHRIHAHSSLCYAENKIEQLDSQIEKEEICTDTYNEEKFLNFLCDKQDLNESHNCCDQIQINSDKGAESSIDSVGNISDLCSCKRCTEEILCTGDKNGDNLKKQN